MNTLSSRLTALAAIIGAFVAIVGVVLTGDVLTAASIDLDGLIEAGRRKP